MYRKYKIDHADDYYPSPTPTASRINSAASISRVRFALDSTDDEVERCWNVIDGQCWTFNDGINSGRKQITSNISSHDWRTIRLFVSSTFTDFHNEREILVKQVFPALREWCENRKLYLVECDLRWGVPKESPSAMAISTCMEEIDRCHEETNNEPFFINMLSERYGWIPSATELPEDLVLQYNWVPGVSITHMEILHGAYRLQNPNALFCVRNPSFLQDIPPDHRKSFIDEERFAKQHLQKLKTRLWESFPRNQVVEYYCDYAGMDQSSGREKVVLSELEDFAQKVLIFFQTAIDRKYPGRQEIESFSQDEQEENIHLDMMEIKSRHFQGRQEELSLLTRYTVGEVSSDECKTLTDKDGDIVPFDDRMKELLQKQGGQPTDTATLCVVGDSGLGKSALTAQFAKHAKQEGLNVLFHCVGCTSDSLKGQNILVRIIKALRRNKSKEPLSEIPVVELHNQLASLFKEWRESQKQLLIVIDAVDELDSADKTDCLSWLPVRFPGKIRCIVSVNSSHHICLSRLIDQQVKALHLQPLDLSTSERIAENFFQRFNKKLGRDQLELLLNKSSATIPHWLSLACEELRVFGDFRMLTRKISTLPEDLTSLLETILNRLIKEDETGLIIKVLCLIYTSLHGIPESEMKKLLGDLEKQEEIPLLMGATIRRKLKPSIHSVIYWYNGVLRMQFCHKSVTQAVKQVIMSSEQDETRWHKLLADYYQYHCEDNTFTLEDLPYHLHQAKLYKRLADFYHQDLRSVGGPHFRQKYLNMLRCTRHTPNLKNLSRPVKICSMCANKPRLVSPMGFPTRQSCIICGSFMVSHPSVETVGRLCMQHCGKFGMTSDQCYFCERIIQGSAITSNQGLVCPMCSSGIRNQRCCRLVF